MDLMSCPGKASSVANVSYKVYVNDANPGKTDPARESDSQQGIG